MDTSPLGHFGKISRTFENRLWVSEEHYRPGDRVFLFDVGEVSSNRLVGAKLQNALSDSAQILKEFNAIGIVWDIGQDSFWQFSGQLPSFHPVCIPLSQITACSIQRHPPKSCGI